MKQYPNTNIPIPSDAVSCKPSVPGCTNEQTTRNDRDLIVLYFMINDSNQSKAKQSALLCSVKIPRGTTTAFSYNSSNLIKHLTAFKQYL